MAQIDRHHDYVVKPLRLVWRLMNPPPRCRLPFRAGKPWRSRDPLRFLYAHDRHAIAGLDHGIGFATEHPYHAV